MTADELEKLYTVEEVARHLGISVYTVKRFVSAGKLAVRRFGRTSRVSAEEFARFLREGTQAPGNVDSPSRADSVRVKRTPEIDRRLVFEMMQKTFATKPRAKK